MTLDEINKLIIRLYRDKDEGKINPYSFEETRERLFEEKREIIAKDNYWNTKRR